MAVCFYIDSAPDAFSTGIECRHVARLVESDHPRYRYIYYPLFYIFHLSNWASSCIYAGGHAPDLVSPRTVFCDVVYMVQEGFMGQLLENITLVKSLSKQTASN